MDSLNKQKEDALIWLSSYQQKAAKFYNAKVVPRDCKVSDCVHWKVFQNTWYLNAEKLSQNWKGPYKVIRYQDLDPKNFEAWMQINSTKLECHQYKKVLSLSSSFINFLISLLFL